MLEFFLLLTGLVVLCSATELSVRSAVRIAHAFRLSPMVIGLTLVAFGTDLPELFVAIRGAFRNLSGIDASSLIVGNAIGSSICQITLVTGIVALFIPARKAEHIKPAVEILLLASAVLLLILSLDGEVSQIEGGILVSAFLAWLTFTVVRRRNEVPESLDEEKLSRGRRIGLHSLLLAGGLTAVVVSAEFVLENALKIAEAWEIGQSFVGAVIVAVGTSLPELAISIGAAVRRQPGLSIGNVVGSNIFDCLVPIGTAALISGIRVDRIFLIFDLPLLLAVSTVFIWFLRRGSNLTRLEGVLLCLTFAGYVVAKFLMR